MKKLFVLLAVSTIAINAISQNFDNEFYIRLGYSSPSWEYFDVGKDNWGDNITRTGGIFELGTIFMIPSILKSENMSFGIDATYLYSNANNFEMKSAQEDFNIIAYKMGSKLGPSFTYMPSEKVAFDVYVKADIAWAALVVPYEESIDDADDFYLGFAPVGLSTGLNFRYGVLMLGVEFNTISPELESDDYEGVYWQDFVNEDTESNSDSKKSKMPNLNFTIGLSF